MTEKEWKNRMTSSKYKELKITTHSDNKPYVFVSYKSDSWELVLTEIVYTLQKKYGLRIYFDKSFNDNNNTWTKQFPENMQDRNCKAVLAFVDNGYYLSYATLLEVMYSQSYIAALGMGVDHLAVIPVNLETIKEPSIEIGKMNTGLGVETFPDGSKNFNAREEKELFDNTFAELTENNFLKRSRYIYKYESLTKLVCSNIMGEMFGDIRVSENIYKPNMTEFYDSLVNTIKSVASDVFDDVAEISSAESNDATKNLAEVSGVHNCSVLNWDEFNNIKSFSYNDKCYNVSDAKNAYIRIVDILKIGSDDVYKPDEIGSKKIPYVNLNGEKLYIPEERYEKLLKPIVDKKIILYAESSKDGVMPVEYQINFKCDETDEVVNPFSPKIKYWNNFVQYAFEDSDNDKFYQAKFPKPTVGEYPWLNLRLGTSKVRIELSFSTQKHTNRIGLFFDDSNLYKDFKSIYTRKEPFVLEDNETIDWDDESRTKSFTIIRKVTDISEDFRTNINRQYAWYMNYACVLKELIQNQSDYSVDTTSQKNLPGTFTEISWGSIDLGIKNGVQQKLPKVRDNTFQITYAGNTVNDCKNWSKVWCELLELFGQDKDTKEKFLELREMEMQADKDQKDSYKLKTFFAGQKNLKKNTQYTSIYEIKSIDVKVENYWNKENMCKEIRKLCNAMSIDYGSIIIKGQLEE